MNRSNTCGRRTVYVRKPVSDSSGVYICKSIVNDLRHGNFICKSEEIYLELRDVILAVMKHVSCTRVDLAPYASGFLGREDWEGFLSILDIDFGGFGT